MKKNGAPYLCIVGKSGSGKTTLIEKLIPALKERGYRVATVKHHAHAETRLDQPGKDTWRHYEAGADTVIVASPVQMATVRRLPTELSLDQVIATVTDVDIVLVEGYSRSDAPKIEIVRAARSAEPICEPGALLALVSDLPLEGAPLFGLDEIDALADWIEARFLVPGAINR